ncbi:hypothetical protein CDD83_3673 [Cordyceps sp. RAO-2017]|nr:hypothetical protein CDD83_3673 [Cordyceps sp. RAO-2017]
MDPDSDASYNEESSAREDGFASDADVESDEEAHSSPRAPDADHLPSQQGSDDESSLSAYERGRDRKRRRIRDGVAHRPFKRQKGVFSAEYLELLNRDIDDAAYAVCLDDDFGLPSSRPGLIRWSSVEKQQFYEALARLGRHDLPGIAARVGTKSPIEVGHYLDFLAEALRLRRLRDRRSFLELAEYPAAVELSQQCCRAQEEAADALSLRQEHREAQREKKKWGDYWDVTHRVAARLDHGRDADVRQSLAFARMFHLGRWLRLSERLFMNSSIPADNWTSVNDVPPSVWATAFDDFYSLVVSVTRRLVQTTLFVSMSRIRAKRELIPKTRDIVRRRDAEAAIASLGMEPNARRFWPECARRLRLNVYHEPPAEAEEEEEEPLAYDEVEGALGEERDGDCNQQTEVDDEVKQESASDGDDISSGSGEEEEEGEGEEEVPSGDQERQEIRREANEILWFSATEMRDVRSARKPLERRIAMERMQEDQARRWDEYASYQAELDLWDLLQREPPTEIPKKQEPGRLETSNLDVESIYPMNGDWAGQLQYRAEWETWRREPPSG